MKNQLREVPKFENIKEIIYNSVKLYPENIAYTIKEKKEALEQAVQGITTKLYEQMAQEQAANAEGSEDASSSDDDDVIDAEYKEVDDDEDKK